MSKKNSIYASVAIGSLVRWDGNPRPPAEGAHRDELKASVADKGVIVPLIVRHASGPKSGPQRMNEVINGDTRRAIVAELVAEGLWDATREIPVVVRDDLVGDDAAALDVALSSNIHVPVHPMDQFSAFSQMVEMGRPLIEIANAYGVSLRVVEQRLSYAKLDERARDLVKSNRRDLEWAAAMTVASPDEQAQILDEIETDPRRYLSVHDVRRRLEDELVPVSIALFDTKDLGEALVRRDLFDPNGASYMKRGEFQAMQDAAVDARVETLRADGWRKVGVVNERQFDRYKYEDGVTDRAIGEVILVRHASGAVSEHAGLTLRVEERLNEVDAETAAAGEAMFSDAAPAVEQTRPTVDVDNEGRRTARYLAVSRAVIVQAAMMSDPRLAIAVTLAGLIQSSAPRVLDGRVFGDMQEMDPTNPARVVVERRMDAARQIMDAAGVDPSDDYATLLDRLVKLDMAQLTTLLQVSVAKRVSTDMARGDRLFEGVMTQAGSIGDFWRPDRAYLATLSKDQLLALGERILPARLAGKLTGGKNDVVETLAQIVDDAHEGGMRLGQDERDALTAWAPASLGGKQEIGAFDPADPDESGQALFGDGDDALEEAGAGMFQTA